MKKIKKLLLGLLAILVLAQFYQPEKNIGNDNLVSFYTETLASEEVQTIVGTSCVDCHSNNTAYPWYNNITPVNIWLKDHVDEGKSHLNFSAWSDYSLKRKAHKMEELAEEVEEVEMPLNSYTWTHRDAVLSSDQIEVLVSWAKSNQMRYELEMGFNDHD